MSKFSTISLIEGLKNRDEKIIELVYRKVYPMIEDYILHNSGCTADAEDIFQEALLIIYRKIHSEEFNLSCKLTTYLYKICHNLWNKELRRKKHTDKSYYTKEDLLDEILFDTEIEKEFITIYLKHIKKLSECCQKILLLHFENKSIEEIMNVMGYKIRQSALDKKYRCKKRLIESIQSDPKFKNLQNELLSVDRKIFKG